MHCLTQSALRGIGVNTGILRLGTIGEAERIESTVIGNAVNVASRIEGLTKTYGVDLLISDKTHAALHKVTDKYIRAIDCVDVKGRRTSITIYEVTDNDEMGTEIIKKHIVDTYAEGIEYYQNKDFKEALVRFNTVLEFNMMDRPSLLLAERCEKMIKQG